MSTGTYPALPLTPLKGIITGCCFQLILFGVVVVVYWSYLTSPAAKATSTFHRLILWLVLVLTTLDTALCTHDLVWLSTTTSRGFLVLVRGTSPQSFEPLLAGVIGALTQSVLTMRVYRIIKKVWLRVAVLVALGCIVVLEVLAALLVSLTSYDFSKGRERAFPLAYLTSIILWMWLAASADICVTAIYILVIYRKLKNGNKTTQSVLYLLSMGSIQSASYTTLFAVLTAIMAATQSYNVLSAFWLELPSLYALSLISTLSIGDRVSNRMREKTDNIMIDVDIASRGAEQTQHAPTPRNSGRSPMSFPSLGQNGERGVQNAVT